LTAAVATMSVCEIAEHMALVHAARLHDGQQPCRGEFSGCAAVPEADLAPLDCPQGSFHGLMGRFDPVVFQEHKQQLEIERTAPWRHCSRPYSRGSRGLPPKQAASSEVAGISVRAELGRPAVDFLGAPADPRGTDATTGTAASQSPTHPQKELSHVNQKPMFTM